jgi:hypothetical protein
MNIVGRIRMVPLLLVLLLSIGTPAMAETNDEQRASAALFDQYETVFYTNADLSSDFTEYKGLPRRAAVILSVPFAMLWQGLASLQKHAPGEILGTSDAVLLGAQGSLPGGEPSGQARQFCYVVTFGHQRMPDLRKFLSGIPVASVGGRSVWKWLAQMPAQGREAPPEIAFFVAQIGDSYLVFSNDVGGLKIVANKLASSDTPSRTLSPIRDWELVSKHEYWGYRRFHRNQNSDETTVQLESLMPGADAVLFFVDVKGKKGTLRLLNSSSNKSVAKKVQEVNEHLATEFKVPPLKPLSEGVWETTFPLSGDQGPGFQIMFALFWFGVPPPVI